MVALTVNDKTYQADVDPDTPLLWVLRDTIGLTGTKYGCGIAQCGARRSTQPHAAEICDWFRFSLKGRLGSFTSWASL